MNSPSRPRVPSILRPNFRPTVPDVPPMERALGRSQSLNSLLQRLRLSQLYMQILQPYLPPGTQALVQPGPVDDEGWTLLVANAALSSKLRQLLPRLQEALEKKGHKVNAIRLKVQTRR
jgi:Dna[CI] antecedent, DciA